jgi:protein-S-isoprenylcysteine O-methyltransferase Ste14
MRQVKSFTLPFAVLVIVPFLLLIDFSQPRLRVSMPHPIAQIAFGTVHCVLGLVLMIATISRFIHRGRGTLAPWDPPSHLEVDGPYAHTRNPMISGVGFVLLGEAALFWSLGILIWFAVFAVVNTLYFKLSEEPALVRRFGEEYRVYRKHVPMWFPRLKPWRTSR